MNIDEHIAWCKNRAIEEYDFYNKTEGHFQAVQNGCASMASDMNKHDETRNNATNSFIILSIPDLQRKGTRQHFVNFINGFR